MRNIFAAAAFCAVLATGLAGRGMFINNSVKVPVDRVVANVEKWIKDNPKDAQAYYVLGRIHAMAWAYGKELNLWKDLQTPPDAADPFNGKLPGFAPYDSIEVRRQDEKPAGDDIKHLDASIKNYRKAVELDPNNALYELGLAWVLQQAGKSADNLPADFGGPAAKPSDAEKAAYDAAIKKLGDADAATRDQASKTLRDGFPKSYAQIDAIKSDDPEVTARRNSLVQTYWDLQALAHYRKAYAIDKDKDANGFRGPAADSLVSVEAADAALGLLKDHPDAAKPDEVKELTAARNNVKGGAVTPVVFSFPNQPAGLPPPAHVGDLVDSAARVPFDLAGDGVARQWPWLKPGTALLVWDPGMTGHITSGKQLFGSRTWWIFFRDGYEALRTLDDNHDGELTGDELQGIAVWIDKNGNGLCDGGEEFSLQQAGIAAIGVNADKDSDGTLTSTLRLTDGRAVRTFDWVIGPATAVPTEEAEHAADRP